MKKRDAGEVILKIKVRIEIDWRDALKMRFMGRYPSAILARAIAEKIRAT
jgi:hypothetical protein